MIEHIESPSINGLQGYLQCIKRLCANGYVFGGYSPTSIRKTENSFLFSLVNPAGTAPTKYNVTNPDMAVYNDRKCGPRFGDDDICCWHGDGESCIFFPTSYEDTTGRGVQTFTGGEVKREKLTSSRTEMVDRVYFEIDLLESSDIAELFWSI